MATTEPLRQFGDYELEREIARGGMGVVYRARQISLNRPVALKMILSAQLASENDVQRFHLEAEAAANLDHPGIVPIYEVGVIEDQHFFSMGLVEGGSLADKVKQGLLPSREAAELVQQVAEAVHYAHTRNIVHRDLKPANVLLDVDGQPRVADFGLARNVEGGSGLTLSGQILGTPGYMPPEQAAGRMFEIGPLADVYSLGAILYCLLTGQPPFRGDGILDTLRQVQEKEPVPPGQLNDQVDLDLETICLKCLEKDSTRRYSSAAALSEELQRFLSGEPITARPVGKSERLIKWVKRKPALASLLLAVPLALIATFVAIIYGIKGSYEAERAEKEARAAKTARALAQQRRYDASMRLAHNAWEDRNLSRFLSVLTSLKPQPEQRDLRDFEWHYWWNAHNRGLAVLKGHKADVRALAVSPNGKMLASGDGGSREKNPGELLLWDVQKGKVLHRLGFKTRVKTVAFSRDGSFLAAGSGNHFQTLREVKVWRLEGQSPKLIHQFTAFPTQVTCVDFSRDGNLLVAGGFLDSNGFLKIWDLQTGQEVFESNDYPIMDLCFSPNGNRLATATGSTQGPFDGKVILWSVSPNGKQVGQKLTIPTDSRDAPAIAFNGDGSRLAIATYRGDPAKGHPRHGITVWDLKSEQQERVLRLQQPTGDITAVRFSPDNQSILASNADRTVRVWDAKSGSLLHRLRGHNKGVSDIAFLPTSDGRHRLISASIDRTIHIRDNWQEQTSLSLLGHTDQLHCVAFHPGGKLVGSGGFDGTARVWDVLTGREKRVLDRHKGKVWGLAFSPNGKQMATASGRDGEPGDIKVWDWENKKKPLHHFRGHTNRAVDVVYHPNGQVLASLSGGWGRPGEVKLWDLETDREMMLPLTNHTGVLGSVAFSPNGKHLAWCGVDADTRKGIVRVWSLSKQKQKLEIRGRGDMVIDVAFSHDGRLLATASGDGTIQLWNAETGEERQTLIGHQGRVHCIAFGPRSRRLVSSGQGRVIKLWNLLSGEDVLNLNHDTHVWSVAYSPNGNRIASAGAYDRIVKVWNGAPSE